MPWLWVVLLPFIDEDRLLGALSPTMTKWTKEELLCNARGLDDGYLYVHRSNPLAKKLSSVLHEGKTAKSPKIKLTDAASYGCGGFSGSIRPPLSTEFYAVDEDVTIPPPPTAGRIDRTSDDNLFSESVGNVAVCVAFSEPLKLSHKSVVLPGARFRANILSDEDKRIRRPRLNRSGGTIANMGTSNGQSYQSGYGSMNVSAQERQLAERTGRGHQMYQAGTRAWGAMEPTPKRLRPGPPPPPPPRPHIGNPFMRNGPVSASGGPPNRPPWQQAAQNSHIRFNQNAARHGRQPAHQQYQQQDRRYEDRHQQHNAPQGYDHRGQGGPPRHHPSSQLAPNQQHHQQQGYNFRNFNNGAPQQQQRRGPSAYAHGSQHRPRANADVMNNLRAQLTSTLKRNRNGSEPHNRR